MDEGKKCELLKKDSNTQRDVNDGTSVTSNAALSATVIPQQTNTDADGDANSQQLVLSASTSLSQLLEDTKASGTNDPDDGTTHVYDYTTFEKSLIPHIKNDLRLLVDPHTNDIADDVELAENNWFMDLFGKVHNREFQEDVRAWLRNYAPCTDQAKRSSILSQMDRVLQ